MTAPAEVKTLWDRRTDGGFPETKELKRRVRDVIEPGRNLGHVDRDHAREKKEKEKEKEEKEKEEKGKEEKGREEKEKDEKQVEKKTTTDEGTAAASQECEDCAT